MISSSLISVYHLNFLASSYSRNTNLMGKLVRISEIFFRSYISVFLVFTDIRVYFSKSKIIISFRCSNPILFSEDFINHVTKYTWRPRVISVVNCGTTITVAQFDTRDSF